MIPKAEFETCKRNAICAEADRIEAAIDAQIKLGKKRIGDLPEVSAEAMEMVAARYRDGGWKFKYNHAQLTMRGLCQPHIELS